MRKEICEEEFENMIRCDTEGGEEKRVLVDW